MLSTEPKSPSPSSQIMLSSESDFGESDFGEQQDHGDHGPDHLVETQDEDSKSLIQQDGPHHLEESLDEDSANKRGWGWWLLLGVLGVVAGVAVTTVIVQAVLPPRTEFLAPSTPASGGVAVSSPSPSGGPVAAKVVAPAEAGPTKPPGGPVAAQVVAPAEASVKGPMPYVVATELVKEEIKFNYAGETYVEKVLHEFPDDMKKVIKLDPRWPESLRNIAQRPKIGTEANPDNTMGRLLLTNGVAAVLNWAGKSSPTRDVLLAYSIASGRVVRVL